MCLWLLDGECNLDCVVPVPSHNLFLVVLEAVDTVRVAWDDGRLVPLLLPLLANVVLRLAIVAQKVVPQGSSNIDRRWVVT